MQDKLVALVTGANQGIGLQITARILVARNSLYWSGRAICSAAKPRRRRLDRTHTQSRLDVTDQDSITAAAAHPQWLYSTCSSKTPLSRIRKLPGNPSSVRTGVDPTTSSMKCARCGTPTCSVSPFTGRCYRSCARRRMPVSSVICIERCRLADYEFRPDFHLPSPIFGPVYAASKTALNALTVAMALELGKGEGIKVNAVSPGFTETNLNEDMREPGDCGRRRPQRRCASRYWARTAPRGHSRAGKTKRFRGDEALSAALDRLLGSLCPGASIAANVQMSPALPPTSDGIGRKICYRTGPQRTMSMEVVAPFEILLHGDEGEVHGEFDAVKLHVAPLIVSVIAQIGFTGGRECLAVPVLHRRESIRASGG